MAVRMTLITRTFGGGWTRTSRHPPFRPVSITSERSRNRAGSLDGLELRDEDEHGGQEER